MTYIIKGALGNGGDFLNCDSSWAESLGPSAEGSRARHEHKLICEVFHCAIVNDRVNIKNLRAFDKLGKRMRYIHRSQKREEPWR